MFRYPWMTEEDYTRCCGGHYEHSALWNAMIHPMLNLTIYGAVWYQGKFCWSVVVLLAIFVMQIPVDD